MLTSIFGRDMLNYYDRIVIGSGIYGLYAAITLAKHGYSALVLDCVSAPFLRGSLINQTRIHNGYHYPRSFLTVAKSAKYFGLPEQLANPSRILDEIRQKPCT